MGRSCNSNTATLISTLSICLFTSQVQAWNDHYDEEDDTWVLKVLLPILGAVVVFCVGGCFYQHHLRKKSEADGTTDRDVTGTDAIPDNLKSQIGQNQAGTFAQNATNNQDGSYGVVSALGNQTRASKVNLNTPPTINPAGNYTQVTPSKILPPFSRQNTQNGQHGQQNYTQIGGASQNYTPQTPVFSIPRSASCAFAANYDFQKPAEINRSTSVLHSTNNSNYNMELRPNPFNLPRRGQSMNAHSNYLNRPVASFQNNTQQPSNQNQQQPQLPGQDPAQDQIYIESGSSESNYSAVDALGSGVHKQNLLPGMGQSNNSHINRRAFRNRYNRNGLRSKAHSISQYDLNSRNFNAPATLSNIDRSTSARQNGLGGLAPHGSQTQLFSQMSPKMSNYGNFAFQNQVNGNVINANARSSSFHSELGPPIGISSGPLNEKLRGLGGLGDPATASRSAGPIGFSFRQNGDSGMVTSESSGSPSDDPMNNHNNGRNISDGNQTDTTYVSVGRSVAKPASSSDKMSSLRRAYSLTDLDKKPVDGCVKEADIEDGSPEQGVLASQIFSQDSEHSTLGGDNRNNGIGHGNVAGLNALTNSATSSIFNSRPVPQPPVYNRLANSTAFTAPSTDPYTRAAQSMYETFTPLSMQQRPTSLVNQAPTGNFAYGTNPVRTQSMLTPAALQNSPFSFQVNQNLSMSHNQSLQGLPGLQNAGGLNLPMSGQISGQMSGQMTPAHAQTQTGHSLSQLGMHMTQSQHSLGNISNNISNNNTNNNTNNGQPPLPNTTGNVQNASASFGNFTFGNGQLTPGQIGSPSFQYGRSGMAQSRGAVNPGQLLQQQFAMRQQAGFY